MFAKPSDFEHGLRYALGSALLSGPPYLLIAGGAWRALARTHRATAVALAVHVLALLGVGGDWMPVWRLAMPVFPGILLVASLTACGRSSWPLLLGIWAESEVATVRAPRPNAAVVSFIDCFPWETS